MVYPVDGPVGALEHVVLCSGSEPGARVVVGNPIWFSDHVALALLRPEGQAVDMTSRRHPICDVDGNVGQRIAYQLKPPAQVGGAFLAHGIPLSQLRGASAQHEELHDFLLTAWDRIKQRHHRAEAFAPDLGVAVVRLADRPVEVQQGSALLKAVIARTTHVHRLLEGSLEHLAVVVAALIIGLARSLQAPAQVGSPLGEARDDVLMDLVADVGRVCKVDRLPIPFVVGRAGQRVALVAVRVDNAWNPG
mmetsp:Transcript_42404/g.106869  ORF Transcript_42404/g.106869 Transcript_42404/m.106869 type:complete len:249 (-) Transcript_42404:356-1102(-)